MMESSRVFVRGLPPNMNAEEFRKHFSKHSAITDVKFMPHRRIGYVGYKSPEDAASAVKYHNRSFIRTSRIGVEIARSVEEQAPMKLERLPANALSSNHACKGGDVPAKAAYDDKQKRKYGTMLDEGSSTKFQEFLEVMQPPSKSKTWQNQAAATQDVTYSTIKVLERENNGAGSDEEYESVPKKLKNEGGSEGKTKVLEPPKREASPPQSEEATKRARIGTEADRQELSDALPAASDADWLRSRTSRLLGLVDDDNALDPESSPEHEEVHQKVTQSRVEGAKSPGGADEGIQMNHEASEANETAVASPSTEAEDSKIGNGRLFVRNLTYTITEEELRQHLAAGGYGTIEEVHLPVDSRSGCNKGFAHIQYVEPEAALKALQELDQRPFQGRLLHIMPAESKKENILDESAISRLPLKKQQQIKRKAEAASATFNWNSMYMNSDAVVSSISDRLGVSKWELLDPTSSGAGVRQAHAETHVIQETKSYFVSNGVDLEAFKKRERGNTAILVKNFSYGTKPEELKQLFEAHGNIRRMLMPPSGTVAIVEFMEPDHARSAFGSLAYRKFKDSILFLEKAPKGLFKSEPVDSNEKAACLGTAKPSVTDLFETNGAQQVANTSTLFIRNLNFITTTDRLREVFQPLDGFMSARVKTKQDPKKPGQLLSMGFGFLEFRSNVHAQAALAAMDGYKLDGHELLIRPSQKSIDAAEDRRNKDNAKRIAGRKTKILIKNLPFEASKKDVQSLFGPYGKLRTVRLPKKLDSSTRGFAFADFVTAKEAENAMDALKDTHLLGRRLVLDFAAEDSIDPEEEIEKMQRRVGKQTDKVALQKLAGSGRKKFNVEGVDGLDQG